MAAMDHKSNGEFGWRDLCIWCHESWPCEVAWIRRELAEHIRGISITPSGHPSYDDGKDAGLDLAAERIDC